MTFNEVMEVKNADMTLGSYGWFALNLDMVGEDTRTNFGGRCLGIADLDMNDSLCGVKCNEKAIEEILRIMDVLGAYSFQDMVGKKARVYFKDSLCYRIESLDGKKYFDYNEFYSADSKISLW